MTNHRTRLGLGACAAGLAVLAVAGCSGGSPAQTNGGVVDGAALSLVADSMNKATSAGSVKVTGTVDAPGGVTMNMTMDEQSSPSLEMSMTMTYDGQNISEILVGDTLYMNYPLLSAIMGGKQWGEIQLRQVKGSLGSLSSLVDSARNENPTAEVEALVASGTVTKVGTDTVDGQQTTHYHGTANPSTLLDSGAGAKLTPAQLAQVKQLLQSQGITSQDIDLWVASDGLPVELKTSAQTSLGAATADLHMSDWGAPVQVGAPPAADVYNMTGQISKAASGIGVH